MCMTLENYFHVYNQFSYWDNFYFRGKRNWYFSFFSTKKLKTLKEKSRKETERVLKNGCQRRKAWVRDRWDMKEVKRLGIIWGLWGRCEGGDAIKTHLFKNITMIAHALFANLKQKKKGQVLLDWNKQEKQMSHWKLGEPHLPYGS